MKKLYRDRLLKLAAHLETGKLGHKKFDFSTYNSTPGIWELAPKECGTNGCAIGECPFLFPKHWEIRLSAPVLKNFTAVEYLNDSEESGEKFFGLTSNEYTLLFIPQCPFDPEYYEEMDKSPWNRGPITSKATAKQVAKSIRNFVAWKEKKGE